MTYDDWRETYCQEPLFNEAMARAAWNAAVLKEREECAKLVWQTEESDDEYVSLRKTIADAIRARGEA